MNKKLSIIISAFNASATIGRTLGSFTCRSNLSDFEIIFIDDGSSDRTLEIAKSFMSMLPNMKIFTHSNQGLGFSRNRGIKESIGQYVTFCDADDIFIIENQLNIISKCLDLDLEIGCANGFSLIDNNNFEMFWDHLIIEELSQSSTPKNNYLKYLVQPSACTKFFKRKFIIDNNINFTEHKYFEDIEFTYSALLCAKNVYFFKLPVFIYDAYGKDTITSTSSYDFIDIFDNVLIVIHRANLAKITGPAQLALAASLMRILLWKFDDLTTNADDNYIKLLIATVKCFDRNSSSSIDDFLLLNENLDFYDRRAITAVSKIWAQSDDLNELVGYFIELKKHTKL